MLVRWAGASGDFNPLHYDSAYVASAGLGQVIGPRRAEKTVADSIDDGLDGGSGLFKEISCQYGGDGLSPGTCNPSANRRTARPGTAGAKSPENTSRATSTWSIVKSAWKTAKGEITTSGKATVILPGKSTDAHPG